MFVNLYTPNTAYVSNLVSNDIKSFFFFPQQFPNIPIFDICCGGVGVFFALYLC